MDIDIIHNRPEKRSLVSDLLDRILDWFCHTHRVEVKDRLQKLFHGTEQEQVKAFYALKEFAAPAYKKCFYEHSSLQAERKQLQIKMSGNEIIYSGDFALDSQELNKLSGLRDIFAGNGTVSAGVKAFFELKEMAGPDYEHCFIERESSEGKVEFTINGVGDGILSKKIPLDVQAEGTLAGYESWLKDFIDDGQKIPFEDCQARSQKDWLRNAIKIDGEVISLDLEGGISRLRAGDVNKLHDMKDDVVSGIVKQDHLEKIDNKLKELFANKDLYEAVVRLSNQDFFIAPIYALGLTPKVLGSMSDKKITFSNPKIAYGVEKTPTGARLNLALELNKVDLLTVMPSEDLGMPMPLPVVADRSSYKCSSYVDLNAKGEVVRCSPCSYEFKFALKSVSDIADCL